MKNKLDLFLAVSALAAETLNAKARDVDAKLAALLDPVKLSAEERNVFSQQFHSRRQRMLQLKDEPLEVVAPAKSTAATTS